MNTTPVRLWDLPTRLFHWLLVAGIGFSWFSGETGGNWMEWHERCGIFLLSLLIFRLVWGFMGSDTARFTQFVTSPLKALEHLKAVKAQGANAALFHAGHNPLGAWMVLALLGMILLQAGTGLFATDDIATEGPLAGLVGEHTTGLLTTLHHLGFKVILLLAAIHIAVVLVYRFVKRTNLIKAMVVGSADWPVSQPQPSGLQFKPAWLGLMVFALCYAAVYFGINALAA